MKLILLKDVKSLGKKGDVVEVNEGYGRNFIIPSKAGVLADAKNLNSLKLQKKKEEKLAAEKLAEAQDLKVRLEEAKIVLKMRAGKEGRTFGAISTKEIAEALKEQTGIEVDKKKIESDVPIRNLGGYELRIRLHRDVEAKLHLSVQAAE